MGYLAAVTPPPHLVVHAMELYANHLWQSTLCAAFAALLTLAFRRHRAHVRYGIWLAASMKFLAPFTVLVTLGSQFDLRSPVIAPERVAFYVDAVGHPFSGSELLNESAPAAATPSGPSLTAIVMASAIAIWAVGCAVVLLSWCSRWRRVASIVGASSVVHDGRELTALRRLEAVHGVRRPMTLRVSAASLEPGIFGIFRPVLLWPRGISAHLSDPQIEAILAHEICHAQRRDNVAAALHTLVQALFWFHPFTWWLGTKLSDERERACDERVIQWGKERHVYAESILTTCRFCLEAPTACMAGVTGSDLTARIDGIMRSEPVRGLDSWRKLLLIGAGVALLAGPLAFGVVDASPSISPHSPTMATRLRTFGVVSVKANTSGKTSIQIGSASGGRFTATNTPLQLLLRFAYGMQDFQILGGPAWKNSDRFDIEATIPDDGPMPLGGSAEVRAMMQALLAERFKLVVRKETRELPTYALMLATGAGTRSSALRRSTTDCAAVMAKRISAGAPPAAGSPSAAERCGLRIGAGSINAGAAPMSELARTLSMFTGRIVIDKTGLSGTFDLDLNWTPDQAGLPGIPRPLGVPDAAERSAHDRSSMLMALQEQLGLTLESRKGPVEVLVIENLEKPARN